MMIRAAIFDFDGTLMDTIHDTHNALNHALTNNGFEPVNFERFIELSAMARDDMLNAATPKEANSPELFSKMGMELENFYTRHFNDNARPYKNIRHALRSLREMGIDLCIITNKPCRLLIPLLNEYFSDIEFRHVVAADSGYPLKPNPASCEQLMQTLDIHHDEVVFIGDSNSDIQIAKNARAFSIGCGWGYNGGKKLIGYGADYVIHDPLGIIDVVNILNRRSLKKIMEEARTILSLLK